MHSADHIIETFAQTCRRIDGASADRLAALIAGGSLDGAIRQAANDDAHDALRGLLAYREALAERRHPGRLIRRLQGEADALEKRCVRLDERAAEWFGKSVYRRARGDEGLAVELAARAEAAEATAAFLREQALASRLAAAVVRSRVTDAACLAGVAAS